MSEKKPSGIELDALIEEKFVGSELSQCRRFYSPPINYPIPSYSSDMSMAWSLVERLNSHQRYIRVGPGVREGQWVAEWGESYREVVADSAPEAICLAVLDYVEAIENEIES